MVVHQWIAGLWVILSFAGCGRTPFGPLDDAAARADEHVDPIEDGCTELDVLFVVDNSSSMGNNQHKLGLSIDGFLSGLETVIDDLESLHVGVVTTDSYAGNAPGCRGIGGLVSQTDGHNSSQRACGPWSSGGPYMTERDDLRAGLECATQVGTQGATQELPLVAARSAVAPYARETVECNEGFIRPGALLMLVFLTDEDASQGTGTYDTLVDLKNGYDESIVVLTIAHIDRETCSIGGHASLATTLLDFTESFEHGVAASICGANFDAPFARAIDALALACES